MFTCATCKKRSCLLYDQKNPPLNCPMQDQITLQECKKAYFDNDGGKLYLSTFETAAEAKELNETRLLEAIRFAKKNGWKKVDISNTLDTKTVQSPTSFQSKTVVVYENQNCKCDKSGLC